MPSPGCLPTLRLSRLAVMPPRSPQWVNTPVLLEALDRYEQGRLHPSMRRWLEGVLELERSVSAPLRPHC